MAAIEIKLVNGELAGKTYQEIRKSVNAAAQEVNKAKVGTEEWVKASKKLEAAKQLQADYTKQLKGTTEASDMLKESFNSLPGAEFFNKIAHSFGMMKKGVGGLIGQFGMLKTAIASTGIGLLVLALASLISYFTTTQEGIDKVTTVTRPLAAIFETLKGVLQDLGGKAFKALAEAVENPMEALRNLGKIILENVINRFKALALFGPAIKKILSGDFSEGFKDLGNAALQAVTGVENVIDKVAEGVKVLGKVIDEAWEKGQRIDKLNKSIEQQEIGQAVRLKTLELLLKQQKDIVEDISKSWDERKIAAENALKTQQAMLNEELSLLDKKIQLMKEEQSLSDTDNAGKKELNELIAKKLELEARTVEQSIEFKKKINELNAAQAQEELAIAQNLQDLKIEVMKDGIEKEIEQIHLDTERKIEALIGTEAQILEQKKLLLEIEEQELQAIKDKYAADAAKKKEDQDKKDLDAAKKKSDEEKRIAQEQADFERELEDIKNSVASDSVSFGADLLAREAKDEKEARKIKKIAGLAEIGINLQKELAANAAAAAANPLNAVSFGAAGTAQLTAMNIASIVRAGIGTVKLLAFKKGGLVKGPSHEQGGIAGVIRPTKQPIEFEGGEFFFSKQATSAIGADKLAAWNNHYTRKFATGGPVNPLSDRAPISSDQSSASMMEQMMRQNLEAITASIIATNARIDRFKVVNVATETQAVNDRIKNIQNEADV